jgi:hypothetical protein
MDEIYSSAIHKNVDESEETIKDYYPEKKGQIVL